MPTKKRRQSEENPKKDIRATQERLHDGIKVLMPPTQGEPQQVLYTVRLFRASGSWVKYKHF